MEQKFISKNHSKFLIKYHFIFVCKYRKKLLINDIELSIKNILLDIQTNADFNIEAMETDKDHIHLLINSEPKLSPLSIVNRLKSISTNRIWKLYPSILQKYFWKEKPFWSDGYFVSSIGNASIDTIKKYIAEQG